MADARWYVTVAGAHKVYSGLKLHEAVDAVWSHVVGYGRVYVKQKDDVGRLRCVEVHLRVTDEKMDFIPELPRDADWADKVRLAIMAGSRPPGGLDTPAWNA